MTKPANVFRPAIALTTLGLVLVSRQAVAREHSGSSLPGRYELFRLPVPALQLRSGLEPLPASNLGLLPVMASSGAATASSTTAGTSQKGQAGRIVAGLGTALGLGSAVTGAVLINIDRSAREIGTATLLGGLATVVSSLFIGLVIIGD